MPVRHQPAASAFAIRNCDAFFTNAYKQSPEATAQAVKDAKADARTQGREIDVYTVGVVTCKPTQREADDYYRYCMVDEADWSAVDAILAKRNISEATVGADEFTRKRLHQANGMGGLPLVGDPDRVASELIKLSEAGLRGIGVSFVNFADELPYFCDEVLPRLERAGLRIAR
jgi:dimethylsulfone monooxygenase